MDRNELIKKADEFLTTITYESGKQSIAMWMADFALSLEAKDEWPQYGDDIWLHVGDGSMTQVVYDENLFMGYLRQGRIHRTEAEAIRANEVEAANAAIKRWRDENAPFVATGDRLKRPKFYGAYDYFIGEWTTFECSRYVLPCAIAFETRADIKRCQSELPDAWAALVGRQG